jgi:hypothetical protein
MALNSTTLLYAMSSYIMELDVVSATGITAPNFTAGSGITYLFIGNEMMQVSAVTGTHIKVVRGQLGTTAASHAASSIILAGLITDFPTFVAEVGTSVAKINRYAPVAAAVASAATITASGPIFHVTGTTATNIINPPSSSFIEGSVVIIADGAWTWASSAVTNGIAVSGAATAGSAIVFTLDAATSRWYPNPAKDTTTVAAAVASGATVAASGPLFHVTGNTAINIITPPTNFSDNSVTIIFDSVCTWTSSNVANGISASGTCTTAGSSVIFVFDPATARWYPSRLA